MVGCWSMYGVNVMLMDGIKIIYLCVFIDVISFYEMDYGVY